MRPPTGLDGRTAHLFLTFFRHARFLVHAILGVRPPAKREGLGSDSQDRMDQRGTVWIAEIS